MDCQSLFVLSIFLYLCLVNDNYTGFERSAPVSQRRLLALAAAPCGCVRAAILGRVFREPLYTPHRPRSTTNKAPSPALIKHRNSLTTYTMLKIADITLRALNFFFLVIVLGLTGSLIHGQDHSNSRVNFALFAAVFGLVTSSFYGILASFIEFLAWPLILITLDILNIIFTFAAAVALAVAVRVHSCTNQDYLDDNAVAQGSTDRCRKGQAATAFLFFSFAVFVFSGILSAISLLSGGAFGGKSKPRTGVPTISTA